MRVKITIDEMNERLTPAMNQYLNALQDLTKAMIEATIIKGKEYRNKERDDDLLANFRRVANQMGLRPSQVAYIYGTKHWDSVSWMIRTLNVSSEGITDRFRDLMNYLVFMYIALREELQEVEKSE